MGTIIDLDHPITAGGNPFENGEMWELRRRQRRQLRMLPANVLAYVAAQPPTARVRDGGLTEWAVRHLADEVAAGHLDLLARADRAMSVETALQYAAERIRTGLLRIEDRMRLQTTLGVLHHSAPRITTSDEDETAAGYLDLWMHLLAWADELAPDGYRDVRLPAVPDA